MRMTEKLQPQLPFQPGWSAFEHVVDLAEDLPVQAVAPGRV